jgi:ligand-binding sensor domain-containing protein
MSDTNKIIPITFLVLLVLTVLCLAVEKWTIYTSESTEGGLPTDRVYSIAIDKNGHKWIGTREDTDMDILAAVVKFDGNTWINQNLELSSHPEDADLNNRIWIIFIDSKNNIWVGTHGDGLFKFNGSDWTQFTMTDGLGGNFVRDIVEDMDGNLWFGCGPEPDTNPIGIGGLTKYNGTSFTRYVSNNSGGQNVGGGNSELADNYVYALTIDHDGNIWAGTKGSGVSRLSTTGEWNNYSESNSPLPDNIINAGAADTDLTGCVWMGFASSNNRGAAFFCGTTWEPEYYLSSEDTRIRDIVHDHHGNTWFGDKSENALGIYKFNGNTNWDNWTAEGTDLSNGAINMMAIEHSTGDVWIATDGGGLCVLNGVIDPSALNEHNAGTLKDFKLSQNYPNPFNPQTSIEYSLNQTQRVELIIYDLSGKLIRSLVNDQKSAGKHTIQWDGRDEKGKIVSSGVYLYTITTELGYSRAMKAILLR